MNVWVLAVCHEDEITTSVHPTKEHAVATFYSEIVLEYWDNEMMGCDPQDAGTPPDAIQLFMEVFSDSYDYTIQKCRLPDGIVPEEPVDEESETLMTPGELEIVGKSLLHVNLERVSKEFRNTSPEELEDRIIEIAKKMG